MRQRGTVRRHAAGEVVPLHDPGKTLADRHAGDIDTLAFGKPIHLQFAAELQVGAVGAVDFALDVTLNREQQIVEAFGGELFAMHRAACAAAHRTAMVAVPAPFDVVVATNAGYPLDQNLYQAVKGMSAAAQIVSEGGLILVASRCNDGFPDHGNFRKMLLEHDSPEASLRPSTPPASRCTTSGRYNSSP